MDEWYTCMNKIQVKCPMGSDEEKKRTSIVFCFYSLLPITLGGMLYYYIFTDETKAQENQIACPKHESRPIFFPGVGSRGDIQRPAYWWVLQCREGTTKEAEGQWWSLGNYLQVRTRMHPTYVYEGYQVKSWVMTSAEAGEKLTRKGSLVCSRLAMNQRSRGYEIEGPVVSQSGL